jgi:hypothetical protein
MDELYNPETFLTEEVLSEILSNFSWPEPYTLEDDLPDAVIMRFPKCNLCFYGGFESDVGLFFLTSDTKTSHSLKLEHALSVLIPEKTQDQNFAEPKLIGFFLLLHHLKKSRMD